MNPTLNSIEQREYDELQKKILAFFDKHEAFARIIDQARQAVEQLIANEQAAMKALPDTKDPLSAYRKIAETQAEIQFHKAFIRDSTAILPRLLDGAKPLEEKQKDIERRARQRAMDLRRYQEEIDKYGPRALGGEQARLEKLRAEQAA